VLVFSLWRTAAFDPKRTFRFSALMMLRCLEKFELLRTMNKRNMTLSDWANVAEIVGAVAVVITLVYVATQIEQNTIAVEASTRQGRLDFGWQQSELLITQPGLAKLVMDAEKNANVLNDEERVLFYEFTTWRMATWELTYQEYVDGLMDEETWAAWNGYYMLMATGKPGYRAFFSDTRQQWDSRFMVHVDQSLGLSN
jgi:hypothetical protein